MAIDWASLIETARRNRPSALKVEGFIRTLKPSGWRPVALQIEGGLHFATKCLWRSGIPTHDGLPPGRTRFNDQLTSRLGSLMRAPVPEVALIDVPQSLIEQNLQAMGHLRAGIAHGSRLIEKPEYPDPKHQMRVPIEPQNRPRFALLAVLFGWTNCAEDTRINDAEFVYDAGSDVYAIDFGNFFGGPDWKDITHLQTPAKPNAWIVEQCKLSKDDLSPALGSLSAITPERLAGAVATAPDEWGVAIEQRVALIARLHERQTELLNG